LIHIAVPGKRDKLFSFALWSTAVLVFNESKGFYLIVKICCQEKEKKEEERKMKEEKQQRNEEHFNLWLQKNKSRFEGTSKIVEFLPKIRL